MRLTGPPPSISARGAGDAQDPVIAPRRQPHAFGGFGQQGAALGVRRRHLFEDFTVGLGIGADRTG